MRKNTYIYTYVYILTFYDFVLIPQYMSRNNVTKNIKDCEYVYYGNVKL